LAKTVVDQQSLKRLIPENGCTEVKLKSRVFFVQLPGCSRVKKLLSRCSREARDALNADVNVGDIRRNPKGLQWRNQRNVCPVNSAQLH
jgi:hypothetical protein